MGGKSLGVDADISRPDDVDEVIQKTGGAFGKLDIFVNNAGIEKKVWRFVDYPLRAVAAIWPSIDPDLPLLQAGPSR